MVVGIAMLAVITFLPAGLAVSGRSSTVLFVEHDMEIVERYAARVLAFTRGASSPTEYRRPCSPTPTSGAMWWAPSCTAAQRRRADECDAGNSGFSVAVAGAQVLNNVTLSAPEGAFAGLIGRNGAGKTTLMRAIMGLLPIQSGSIRIFGRDVTAPPALARAGLGIGYMPEDRRLVPEPRPGRSETPGRKAAGPRL